MGIARRLDRLTYLTEQWRETAFKPLLIACRFLNISANQVTALRVILAGGFIFLINDQPIAAGWLIGLSIALDAFDGALARFLKTDTDRGKFIDVFADQLTFAFLCLGLIRIMPGSSLVLAANAIVVPALYLIAAIRNNEDKPSDWIIKPQARLTAYKIIFISALAGFLIGFWNEEMMVFFFWITAGLATAHLAWHYLRFLRTHTFLTRQ